MKPHEARGHLYVSTLQMNPDKCADASTRDISSAAWNAAARKSETPKIAETGSRGKARHTPDEARSGPYELLHTRSKKEDDLKARHKHAISGRVTASPLTAVCILNPKFRSLNSCVSFVSFIFIHVSTHSNTYNSFSRPLNTFRLCISIPHAELTNQNAGVKSG